MYEITNVAIKAATESHGASERGCRLRCGSTCLSYIGGLHEIMLRCCISFVGRQLDECLTKAEVRLSQCLSPCVPCSNTGHVSVGGYVGREIGFTSALL